MADVARHDAAYMMQITIYIYKRLVAQVLAENDTSEGYIVVLVDSSRQMYLTLPINNMKTTKTYC